MININSQRNLQAHLKTPQISTQPKFLKELTKPTKERISIFFLQRFKKLKHPTLKPTKNKTTITVKRAMDKGVTRKKENTPAANIGYTIWPIIASFIILVRNENRSWQKHFTAV